MQTSQGNPATHAGTWIDQIARLQARLRGAGRRVWRPEEEIAMQRTIRQSRVATIEVFNIQVAITLRPRHAPRTEATIERAAQRQALSRTLAQERSTAQARLLLRG